MDETWLSIFPLKTAEYAVFANFFSLSYLLDTRFD